MRSLVLLACCAVLLPNRASAQTARADSTDPYVWLEEVHGERAMAWVNAENAKTTAVFEKDPRWQSIYSAALKMAQAQDRLPYVSYIGGELYNFWRDSAHVRGIWRKTSLASYRTASPNWTTVLDLDALAKAENANWVFHGYTCQQPAEKRCLMFLSDGGEDASTIREFDLPSRSFVKGGFYLPKGKQQAAWTSQDTILVAREWNPGEVTSSGYAYIVKRLARGQPLTAAVEIFRGSAKDGGYGVSPQTMVDAAGHRYSFIIRPTSTFEAEHYIVRPKDVARLAIPEKGYFVDIIGGQVVVHLYEDWTTGGKTIRGGAVAAFDGTTALRTPNALTPVAIFEPGPRESVAGVSATKDKLLIDIYQNVKGKVLVATRAPNGTWSHTTMKLPDNVSTNVVSTDTKTNDALVSVTGFLTPSSIWFADAAGGTASELKTLAPRFDASASVVEQMEATSKDGTKVPYFIVHPKSMARDGSNPTILYAYGGFNASMTPRYDPDVGKLWVEQGGV